MWCSMFAFHPWHSAIEMKRYLLRLCRKCRVFCLAGGTADQVEINMIRLFCRYKDGYKIMGFNLNPGDGQDVNFVRSADAHV